MKEEKKIKGIMLDISRGQIPNLRLMKKMLDIIGEYDINFISLYFEHTFPYKSHPLFWEKTGAWNIKEIKKILEYAKIKNIDIIPAIQTLGHFEKILRHKEYAHLAETDLHYSVAPSRKETYMIIEDMIREIAATFPSPYINIGGDEVWDMGEGQSQKMVKKVGSKNNLFYLHIQKIVQICKKYNKHSIVWGDMFFKYNKFSSDLKKQILVFNWEYNKEKYAELQKKIATLGKRKIKQVICPGASTWSVLFPDVSKAINNIKNSVKAGENFGKNIKGYMITTWGDHGNFNFLGEALPGFLWFEFLVSHLELSKKIQMVDFNKIFYQFFGVKTDYLDVFISFGDLYKFLQLKNNHDLFHIFWEDVFLIKFSQNTKLSDSQLKNIQNKLLKSYDKFKGLNVRKNKMFYNELLYKMQIVLSFFDRFFLLQETRKVYQKAFSSMGNGKFVDSQFRVIFYNMQNLIKQTKTLKRNFVLLWKKHYRGESLKINIARFTTLKRNYKVQYDQFKTVYKFYKKRGGGLIQPSEFLINQKNVKIYEKNNFLLDFYRQKQHI